MEIDGQRPDLTKFDAMLGQIALDANANVESEEEEKEAEEFARQEEEKLKEAKLLVIAAKAWSV